MEVTRYLTQTDVGRLANVHDSAAMHAVRRGELVPDAYAGRAPIFLANNPTVLAYAERLARRSRK